MEDMWEKLDDEQLFYNIRKEEKANIIGDIISSIVIIATIAFFVFLFTYLYYGEKLDTKEFLVSS